MYAKLVFPILILILDIFSCGSNGDDSERISNINSDSDTNTVAFYISPSGSDANSGTSDSPWKTFEHAISQLHPGDTLILKDGTYTKSTTGLPNINCSSGNVNNGLEGNPITIKAENERKAYLKSDGSAAALLMTYCSYWTVEGLRGSSADLDPASGGNQFSIFQIEDSNNLILRRLLAHHTNRYFNVSAITLARVESSLVEECEVYYFHRFGMLDYGFVSGGNNNVFRRDYANSRLWSDLSGGYPAVNVHNRGDAGIATYGNTGHLIIENCIAENNGNDLGIGNEINDGIESKLLGSISINNLITLAAAVYFTNGYNLTAENVVTVSNDSVGMYWKAVKNGIIKNVTIYNGDAQGITTDNITYSQGADSNASINISNALLFDNSTKGFNIAKQSSWLIEYSNSYNNHINYWPPETIDDGKGKIINSLSTEPTLMGTGTNQCIVYVPGGHDGHGGTNPKINGQSSNMAGAGKDGEDIGANIVYRYENGVLKQEKLWDQTTGQFPCGAIVEGVNDNDSFPNSSCVNVHYRLNVGVNGCPIP